MSIVDWGMIVVAIVGLGIWVRGCKRRSVGDCWLGRREQDGGNWYYSEQYQMEGWLCPALFKFFPRAPRHIYVRAEAK